MTRDGARILYDELYRDIDGHRLSREGRQELPYFYIGHTYGEITFDAFWEILEAVSPKPYEVFYDIGSGLGRAVVVASLFTDFSKLVGIEIISKLHAAASQVQARHADSRIRFINDDAENVNFEDADVIFMNATCMGYEFTRPFVGRLNNLKPGARIITNTFPIQTDAYSVQNIGPHSFSWGPEEVFIHTKK